MAWKFDGATPICNQIADRLRAEIINGGYAPGGQFPAVRSLAAEAGVNPNTMQKALTLLEDEGLLVALSTTGRYVTDDLDAIARAKEIVTERSIERLIRDAKNIGLDKNELIKRIEKGWS